MQVFDAWSFERANGGTTVHWDGYFSGTIMTYTFEPGCYTAVVRDTAGTALYTVVEVIY